MPDKTEPADLKTELVHLEAVALLPVATPAELANNLNYVYQGFTGIDFAHYDVRQLTGIAPSLIQSLFRTRMQLRDRLREWRDNGFLDANVVQALRNVFRAMRYAGDMLGEIAIDFRRMVDGASPLPAFRGRDTNTLINPRFDEQRDLPFRSGDVLLGRGRLHNSAAIARIGDVDSQYSHVGIVYVDPKGLHWIVEALIEEGAIVQPLADALTHDLGRAILLRHRDAALAQRAAFIAHEHVKQSHSRYGKPIPYDFSMQLSGLKRMFCTKLVRYAYERASEGRLVLPAFPTHLSMKNRDFFDRIGVTAIETFAPGDMELEPDFDVVAEWQDYRVTASLRHQDMVMDKLFAWMDDHNMKFEESFLIGVISKLGKWSAGLSNTIKSMIADVVPKVPSHMKRRTIAAIVMLHRTAEPIMTEITDLERERIRVFGHPLHPREVMEYLERMREHSTGEIGYLRHGA